MNPKETHPVPSFGKDGLCQCSCADVCPNGRIGSQPRCHKSEVAIVSFKEEEYKCDDCSNSITEGEYKTFGICGDCWDKHYDKAKDEESTSKELSTCVSCEEEKEVHQLCLECAVKLGRDNPIEQHTEGVRLIANTIDNPLILNWKEGEYKVNKPLDQSGEYVDKSFAQALQDRNAQLEEENEELKLSIQNRKDFDRDISAPAFKELQSQVDTLQKEIEYKNALIMEAAEQLKMYKQSF